MSDATASAYTMSPSDEGRTMRTAPVIGPPRLRLRRCAARKQVNLRHREPDPHVGTMRADSIRHQWMRARMSAKLPLSLVVITRDAAVDIADCMTSASFAAETLI